MFDFHNLIVYKKAKLIHKSVIKLLKDNKSVDITIGNQLKRASVSSVINIAEGSGRFTKADKKNFYIISRGSIYECVSLMDIMLDANVITQIEYDEFYSSYEELSKALFGLIKKLS